MGKKIKKIIKDYIFGFTLGALLFGTVGVLAATYCASSDISYDNSSSGMKSTDVQSAIDEIYQLANSSSSTNGGIYKDENGDIRYYGSNPNNYVSFNNELWRIIGVIDGKTKIIRNEALTPVTTDMQNGSSVTIGTSSGFYWNYVKQSGKSINNWEGSTLQNYLNGTYYNSIDSTYQNMISPSTFYLGGTTSSNIDTLTASGYYNTERDGTKVYSSNPASTTQKIGLMYPSDYGYAAGSSCLSTALYNYKTSCKNSDYLSIGTTEWLQAPYAGSSSFATLLRITGRVDTGYVNNHSIAVRPVLYLTSQTKITGGKGTSSNPYTLG